jgi:nitroreductase
MFLHLLSSRRSIRKFTEQSVEKEKIDQLIEAALRSFSSRSINPWHFIIVDDRSILQQLAAAKPHGAGFLKDAPLGIVVCGDASESDVWVEDTAIASALIHLAAHDLGLGSCWIQIRKREHSALKSADRYVKDLLAIPDNIKIESIIAIGYPDEVKEGHAKDTLQTEKVSFNSFNLKD